MISEDLLKTYQSAKQQAANDKAAKEAEAKAKAKAKIAAKKKAQQAVEDEWLFDGSKDEGNTTAVDSDDDDMGFRMFSAQDLATAPVESRQPRTSETNKAIKVVNLIDFGECDVPEEIEHSTSSSALPAATPAPEPPAPAATSVGSDTLGASAKPAGRPSIGRAGSPGAHLRSGLGGASKSHEEALLNEIDHLRQQLTDAAEERAIQVEMIKDDLVEKQKQVEELTKKNSDMEADLKKANAAVAELNQSLRASQEEAVSSVSEVQTLRTQKAELESQLEAAHAQAKAESAPAPNTAQAEERQAELERHIALQAEERQAEQAELQRLRDEVQAAAASSAASAADKEAHAQTVQRLGDERDALVTEVQSLRQLNAELQKADAGKAATVETKAPSVSEEVAGLLTEVCRTCARTLLVLQNEEANREAAAADNLESPADLEHSLRTLRDTVSSLQTAAERASAERRQLSAQLEDARKVPAAPEREKPVADTVPESAADVSPEGGAAPLARAPAHIDGVSQQVSAEAQAAVQAVNREAARALREVRMNAERQLAWIGQRMRNGSKDEHVAPPKMV